MTATTLEHYRFEAVFPKPAVEIAEQVIAFWLRERALPNEAAAQQRVAQLVYVIRAPDGEIAGVSTAYTGPVPNLGGTFYFYRMFIRRPDRVPGMMRRVTEMTFDTLRERTPAGGPEGVVVVAENRKLHRPAAERQLERAGWHKTGLDTRQQPVWLRRFDALN
ncbi:MAG: hypothetical protein ACRESU_06245 [Gammaproteobacteria bacterium]